MASEQSKVSIEINRTTYHELQNLARPFIDSPDDVIQRLLQFYQAKEKKVTYEKNQIAKRTTPQIAKNEQQNYTTSPYKPQLFLSPARAANIDRSIIRSISVERCSKYLTKAQFTLLKRLLDGERLFNCWATTDSNISLFDKMKPGDYVMLSESGTGKFNYLATIKGTIISEQLGHFIWTEQPKKPWKYVYILENIQPIHCDKSTFVRDLGYSPEYIVPGLIRAKPALWNDFLKKYNSLENYLGL